MDWLRRGTLTALVAMSLLASTQSTHASSGYPWDAQCSGSTHTFDKHGTKVHGCAGLVWIGPNKNKDSGRGYGWRNCTDYVAYLVNTAARKAIVRSGWGDAKDWGKSAKNAGYTYDSHPAVGDVAWRKSGGSSHGHVALVTAVSKDRKSISIEEANWPVGTYRGVTYYDGLPHVQPKVSVSSFDGFIHLGNPTQRLDSPKSLNATRGPTTLKLTWARVANAKQYRVYLNGNHQDTTASTSYTFNGLKCGKAYTLGVQATSSGNLDSSLWSSTATITADTSGCPATPPAEGPTITRIADITIVANDAASYPVRVDYLDDDCDVVGGTWRDTQGRSNDFGVGAADPLHPSGCAGGVGYLTPGYSSCTSPEGVRGLPGKYPQTIIIRDRLGRSSPAYTFYVICQ